MIQICSQSNSMVWSFFHVIGISISLFVLWTARYIPFLPRREHQDASNPRNHVSLFDSGQPPTFNTILSLITKPSFVAYYIKTSMIALLPVVSFVCSCFVATRFKTLAARKRTGGLSGTLRERRRCCHHINNYDSRRLLDFSFPSATEKR